jgi:hypothetical protein
MGLLDLKTDLKSLKFGNPPASDRPGGGNSGQPYITDPIESSINPQSEDFLLRGGINAPLDAANDVIRLTKFFGDLKSPRGILFTSKQNILSRIGAATQASGNQSDSNSWKDSPLNEGAYTPLSTIAQAGVGFTGAHLYKQGVNPLKGVNTYIDSKTLVIGEGNGKNNRLVDLYNTQIPNLGNDFSIEDQVNLYSYSGGPGSKLGVGKTNIRFATDNKGAPLLSGIATKDYQAGIGKSGTDRSTLPPSYNSETDEGVTKTFNDKGSPNPLPIELQYQKGIGGIGNSGTDKSTLPPFYSPLTNKGVTNIFKDEFNPPNINIGLNNENNGNFGRTFETSVYNTVTTGSNIFLKLQSTDRIYSNGSRTWNQEQIESQVSLNDSKNTQSPTTQDFRTPLLVGKQKSTIMSFAPSYNPSDLKTIDGTSTSRINLASPGQKGNIINYTKGKIVNGKVSVVDKINFQPLYKSENVKSEDNIDKNDLVKFRIGAVLRDGEKVYMHFRAFIDKFSDSYDAKWSGTQYMGRGEEFYKYGGFSRKISLSYTVAAQSKPELMAQYKKLNFLASTLAPDYGTNGYMGGVLTTLTLGGWCYELPGFISSLSLDVPQESPWEIAIPATEKDADSENSISSDKTVKEMPHICKVNMSFTPIHTFRPELQDNTYTGTNDEVNSYGKQHYLALSNGLNNNYVPVSLSKAETPGSTQSQANQS